MISKWQDFRKVMEHIKDNDYLGKLKQDLRDIIELLTGDDSFDLTHIKDLDVDSFKAKIDTASSGI
jgi:hypothetical protein